MNEPKLNKTLIEISEGIPEVFLQIFYYVVGMMVILITYRVLPKPNPFEGFAVQLAGWLVPFTLIMGSIGMGKSFCSIMINTGHWIEKRLNNDG